MTQLEDVKIELTLKQLEFCDKIINKIYTLTLSNVSNKLRSDTYYIFKRINDFDWKDFNSYFKTNRLCIGINLNKDDFKVRIYKNKINVYIDDSFIISKPIDSTLYDFVDKLYIACKERDEIRDVNEEIKTIENAQLYI